MKSALLLIVTTCMMLAICEVGARALFKQNTVLTPRYHTSATYGEVTLRRIRPNMEFSHTTPDGSWVFKTNAQGFRNHVDFTYEKPPNITRVVALGDSHTQGHECHQDYTYSAAIQKYLNLRQQPTEVINTGVSGFSTAEALLLLEREMLRYHPDYVILGFFANDFEDNLKAGLFELDTRGNLVLTKKSHTPGVAVQDLIYAIPGVQWLGENSYFYSKLFNVTWDFYKKRLASSARKKIPEEFAVATKSDYSKYEIELAAALINRMAKVANNAGAKFILLDVPQRTGQDEFKSSVPQELRVALSEDAALYLWSDFLEPYQGVAPLHVPRGGRHITEFTHTILGTRVAEFIAQSGSINLMNSKN